MRIRNSLMFGLIFAATRVLADPLVLPDPIRDADFPAVNMDQVALGQLLFWDPILSGSREVSCATCHHPRFGTSDGLSLGLGDGARGLGVERKVVAENLPEQRIPRNSPALFNLASPAFTALFHDGRAEIDPTRPSGFRTPLEEQMEEGFTSLLSAQNMFPVLSNDEMAGHYQENEISVKVRQGLITGPDGAWDRIAKRVAAIPVYAEGFARLDPQIGSARPLAFTDISNAIAAFVGFEWRSDTAPFDAVLRGEATFEGAAARGAALFYGTAGCSTCHSGKFLTDQKFHAMGEPQLGPGKAERFETHSRDIGRMRVTNDPADAYAFRTPSLRNVTLTAPYGHAGAHRDLDGFLTHHADPVAGLKRYDPAQALLPDLPDTKPDFRVLETAEELAAIAAAVKTPPVVLSEADRADLIAFLKTLEDPVAVSGRLGIPERLPSGLPIDR